MIILGRCLDVPVFDRGYKSEPPDIAFEAIKEAAYRKIDVVLIDTAGRMQDNEPLMRSLARLVKENKPDLIIFIGEALVGNDGIDQLVKFNKALIDLSDRNSIREIDAIILSKFDTVDDKVGAAISMTYATGKPILFVGVG
jgi:signal recognition particle receptor subunit alpha